MDEHLKRDLLEIIAEFLERREGAPPLTPDRQLQVAAAILMVSVVRADQSCRQDEHRVLEKAVGRTLGLDADASAHIVRVAEEKLRQDAPFRDLLVLLDGRCSTEEKRRVVESLWRIAYADAELQGQEEYLVRKVAEHLHLSTADLVEAKIRARETFLAEDI